MRPNMGVMAVSPMQTNAATGRSISVLCLLVGTALVAACLINPGGVYRPWEFTFGACVLLVIGSAGSLAYFHSRVVAARSDG
jgi:predicted ribosomally synthesized peptide with SipW-like signal peptide